MWIDIRSLLAADAASVVTLAFTTHPDGNLDRTQAKVRESRLRQSLAYGIIWCGGTSHFRRIKPAIHRHHSTGWAPA